jgi:hypothetical protein
MVWEKNLFASTGVPWTTSTAKSLFKGDFKGAGDNFVKGWTDTSTIGISAGMRDKKKGEEEAARKAEALNQQIGREAAQSLKTQSSLNQRYTGERNKALAGMDQTDLAYRDRVRGLTREAQNSARDASQVYGNMSNQYRSMQEKANEDANNAMSLREYMDPNNRVATSVRGLYDERAEQERLRGQQDFGVLSALGSQATGTMAGGMGPLTVGQQVALQAQNQRQAGEAYSSAQRKMQNLRDQGLQMGFDRSDAAYAAGQGARDRQGNLLQDRRALENEFRNFEFSSRGEREGFSQNEREADMSRFGRATNRAGEDRGMAMEIERARMAEVMRSAGASEAAIQLKLQQMAAEQAQYASMVGSGVSAVGSVVGGMAGGPAGAAAGNAVGQGIGNSGQAGAQSAAPSASRTAQGMNPNAAQPSSFNQGNTPMAVMPQRQSSQSSPFGDYLQRKYSSPGRTIG